MQEGNGRIGALKHGFMVSVWLHREWCQPHQHTVAGKRMIAWLTTMKNTDMAATAVSICERLTPYRYRLSSEAYHQQLTGQPVTTKKVASEDRLTVSLQGTGIEVVEEAETMPRRPIGLAYKKKLADTKMRILRIKGVEVVVCEDPSGFVHLTVVSLRKDKIIGVTTLYDYVFEQHRAPPQLTAGPAGASEEDEEEVDEEEELVAKLTDLARLRCTAAVSPEEQEMAARLAVIRRSTLC